MRCITAQSFTKRNKGVVVKIAGPRKLRDDENLSGFIVESLRGANAMAFEFFRTKGGDFPLREAEVLVARVAESFRAE